MIDGKVVLLGDPHAGVHNGSKHFSEFQLGYLKDVIKFCVESNIMEIWCAGDMFEVRKNTNTEVLDDWKMEFFNALEDNKIILRVLVGNHDMYFKNTISPNALSVHLNEYENVVIYDYPYEMEITKENSVLFVPWMCQENEEVSMEFIRNTKCNIVMGHFEVKGAMMNGVACEDGLPLSEFKKFDVALSGHFHTKGQYEKMMYIGTPYETSWADYGEDKGIHTLDLNTLEIEFFKNPNRLYFKIHYRESLDMDKHLSNEHYKDSYVRVIVEDREDFKKYEKWLMKLEMMGMRELKIVEPYLERNSEDSDIEFNGEIDVITTNELISDYIEEVYPENKSKLNKLMQGLHAEAQRIMS